MRLYGVYMACVWRTMAVYIVGYAVMAYGLGLRDRRVWSVVCTVCTRYGVPCRRGLSVGYGVHVWHVWRVVGVCRRWCTVCYGVW